MDRVLPILCLMLLVSSCGDMTPTYSVEADMERLGNAAEALGKIFEPKKKQEAETEPASYDYDDYGGDYGYGDYDGYPAGSESNDPHLFPIPPTVLGSVIPTAETHTLTARLLNDVVIAGDSIGVEISFQRIGTESQDKAIEGYRSVELTVVKGDSDPSVIDYDNPDCRFKQGVCETYLYTSLAGNHAMTVVVAGFEPVILPLTINPGPATELRLSISDMDGNNIATCFDGIDFDDPCFSEPTSTSGIHIAAEIGDYYGNWTTFEGAHTWKGFGPLMDQIPEGFYDNNMDFSLVTPGAGVMKVAFDVDPTFSVSVAYEIKAP